MTDPILCPVCGREMKYNNYRLGFDCFHGHAGTGEFKQGIYYGPTNDPDGTKIRAQIAAMKARGDNPECNRCVFQGHSAYAIPCCDCVNNNGKHNCFEPEKTAPAQPVPCNDWWRTGTCGECAYHLEQGDWGNEMTPPSPLGGSLPQVVFGSKKCGTYSTEPACPDGERRDA